MALRRSFRQTKLFRALIVLGVLAFFTFLSPRFLFEPVRTALTTLLWPAENFFATVSFGLRERWQFFAAISELKERNAHLERERLELLSERTELFALKEENEYLRRELELLPRNDYSLLGGEVIGRDAAGADGRLTINRGERHGLRTGMPVVVGKGILVGRVTEVFPLSASVTLLVNPASVINGVTQGSGAKGIIKGEHGIGLILDVVLQSDTLQAGDTVITSGLDPSIPHGLLVGTVQEPGYTADRLYQRSSIVTPVPFEDLRYVFVIMR